MDFPEEEQISVVNEWKASGCWTSVLDVIPKPTHYAPSLNRPSGHRIQRAADACPPPIHLPLPRRRERGRTPRKGEPARLPPVCSVLQNSRISRECARERRAVLRET